jgi:hypothetical protein
MDSDSENLNSKKNISLAINFIDANQLKLNWESLKDGSEKENLRKLFQKLKDEDKQNDREKTLDEVSERSIIN